MKKFWICVFVLILEIVDVCYVVEGDDSLKHRVCEQTRSFDVCISVIDSDPNATKADIKGLALIMVNAAPPFIKDSLAIANSIIKTTKDEGLKKKMFVCAKSFIPLLNSVLPQIAEEVNLKKFKNANETIYYAGDVIGACDKQFFTPTQSPIISKNSFARADLDIASDILKQILTA